MEALEQYALKGWEHDIAAVRCHLGRLSDILTLRSQDLYDFAAQALAARDFKACVYLGH